MRKVGQRPSLWQHIKAWDQNNGDQVTPRQLASGPVLIRDSDTVHGVLSSPEYYVDESAFLRTRSSDPLPRDTRYQVISELMDAIEENPPAWGTVDEATFPERRWLRTQSWGIRLMRGLYADALAKSRSAEANRLIDQFINRKTIQDDLFGGYRRLEGEARDTLHYRMGEVLEAGAQEPRSDDLFGALAHLDFPLPTIERGELYLRLVQSVVGFTGAAIEMAVYKAHRSSDLKSAFARGNSKNHLRELQRVFPTAWRLTRTVKETHSLGPIEVHPGNEIIVATCTVHRSSQNWEEAGKFLAHRWSDPNAARSRSYLPFGRGRGMCPGRNVAFDAIEGALKYIYNNYEVRMKPHWFARPYVRSVLSAPTCKMRFTAKA